MYRLLEKIIEIIPKFFTALSLSSAFVGGAVLLIYCFSIGYIPKDFELSQGINLLVISLSFGFLLLLFYLSMTTIGIFFSEIIILLFRRIPIKSLVFRKPKFKKFTYYLTAFLVLSSSISTGIIASSAYINIFKINHSSLLVVFLNSFIGFFSWTSFRCLPMKKGILKTRKKIQIDPNILYLLMLGLIFNLTLIPHLKAYIPGSMLLTDFRRHNCIVHIKPPYAKYVQRENVDKTNKKYVKIENVNILLKDIGKNIVLEISKTSNDTTIRTDSTPIKDTLIIPQEYVFIVPTLNFPTQQKDSLDATQENPN